MEITVRRWPAWRIVKAMKARRIRQQDIAKQAGCSSTTVNHAIARKSTTGEYDAKIWKILEEVLN